MKINNVDEVKDVLRCVILSEGEAAYKTQDEGRMISLLTSCSDYIVDTTAEQLKYRSKYRKLMTIVMLYGGYKLYKHLQERKDEIDISDIESEE